jgi:hypothetical protein
VVLRVDFFAFVAFLMGLRAARFLTWVFSAVFLTRTSTVGFARRTAALDFGLAAFFAFTRLAIVASLWRYCGKASLTMVAGDGESVRA